MLYNPVTKGPETLGRYDGVLIFGLRILRDTPEADDFDAINKYYVISGVCETPNKSEER
jgi:hypothetical protein